VLTQSQIKALLAANGLSVNKRLGQSFLTDKNIVDKLLEAGRFDKEDLVLEIGSGPGNITSDLSARVKKVIAVEFDKGLYKILKRSLSGTRNCETVCCDILDFDLKKYAGKKKVRIVGNLPYYITSPAVEYIIENRDCVKDALLMVQKEVKDRILAGPSTKSYGSMSCYCSYYTKPEFKLAVKRQSFFPQPEVDSALIGLSMRSKPAVSVKDEALFFKIIRASFNQRRKMLGSSLANKGIRGLTKEEIKAVLTKSGVEPTRRPESLSLDEFARISDEFAG